MQEATHVYDSGRHVCSYFTLVGMDLFCAVRMLWRRVVTFASKGTEVHVAGCTFCYVTLWLGRSLVEDTTR